MISVVPAAKGVTSPLEGCTVATVVFEEVQVPPVVPLLVNVSVVPMQSEEEPLTVPAVTFGETVRVMTEETGLQHPLVIAYVISVVPAAKGVTSPLEGCTVATIVFEEVQVPSIVPLLVNVSVVPMQSEEEPLTVPAVTFGETVKVTNEEAGLPHPLLIE